MRFRDGGFSNVDPSWIAQDGDKFILNLILLGSRLILRRVFLCLIWSHDFEDEINFAIFFVASGIGGAQIDSAMTSYQSRLRLETRKLTPRLGLKTRQLTQRWLHDSRACDWRRAKLNQRGLHDSRACDWRRKLTQRWLHDNRACDWRRAKLNQRGLLDSRACDWRRAN